MAKKKPNYGVRRGVVGTAGMSIISGLAGAAGAAVNNPAQTLANAGLTSTPSDIANHIVGSGAIGAIGGAAAAGAYVAHRALTNYRRRKLGQQFNRLK